MLTCMVGYMSKYHFIIKRIVNLEYSFPEDCDVSEECKDLIRQIFVTTPEERLTISQMEEHAW